MRTRSPAETIRDEMRTYRDRLLDGLREEIARNRQDEATSRKAAKLAALIAPGSGATDGERVAAQAALDRLTR